MTAALIRAIELLRARSDASIGAGASSSDVADAETVLGVAFPIEYKLFLLEVGWVSFAGCEVYGLFRPGEECRLSVVKETALERDLFGPPLARHLIPIMNNGSGDLYCLDASDPKGSIVQRLHDVEQDDKAIRFVAPSFGAWLLDLVQASEVHEG